MTIGEVAARSGLTVATLRYYEQRGLISSTRTAGNQRRYPRPVLRRLAFVTAGQRVGLSLDELGADLATLPDGRVPTKADWDRLGRRWHAQVGVRIAELQALQDTLGGCLGCGCLSLRSCGLYNPRDGAAAEGPGSRWLRDVRPSS